MKPEKIAQYIGDPKVHAEILGNRTSYSIGVGLKDTNKPDGEGVIVVRVIGSNTSDITSWIELDGEEVPIYIIPNFVPPTAL